MQAFSLNQAPWGLCLNSLKFAPIAPSKDLVLTDIALPVMDGVEATREILRRHPGMPVVAMTGWEYEERALEVREAGAVDYVRKSRLGPDLVEALVAATRARPGAPSGPSTG